MGKKNVILRMINRQYDEHLVPKGDTYVRELTQSDEMELMTEATVYIKQGSVFIVYREAPRKDTPQRRTIIRITGDRLLEVHRYEGDVSNGMELRLRSDKETEVCYVFPYGKLKIQIFTHELRVDLDEEGLGTVYAEYSFQMGEYMDKRNKLEMTIRPDRADNTEDHEEHHEKESEKRS